VDLRDVLLPVLDMPNVLVSMPGPHPSPVDVLALASATDFFLELRSAADVVLVLAPPSVPFPEASLVATHTDGAVLVARAGTTRARDVRAASRLLAQAEERLVAVLLVAPPVRRVSRVAPSALPVDHQDLRLVPPRVVTAARGG
jgi:receptor protein-tyrosine kinase